MGKYGEIKEISLLEMEGGGLYARCIFAEKRELDVFRQFIRFYFAAVQHL